MLRHSIPSPPRKHNVMSLNRQHSMSVYKFERTTSPTRAASDPISTILNCRDIIVSHEDTPSASAEFIQASVRLIRVWNPTRLGFFHFPGVKTPSLTSLINMDSIRLACEDVTANPSWISVNTLFRVYRRPCIVLKDGTSLLKPHGCMVLEIV
jgi:hypothetical protein